jgi:ribosomal protein S20
LAKKAQRKRPTLTVGDLETYLETAEASGETYNKEKDKDLVEETNDDIREAARQPVFNKGQSRRIWNELYKVIDSSDVVVQVCGVLNLLLVEGVCIVCGLCVRCWMLGIHLVQGRNGLRHIW